MENTIGAWQKLLPAAISAMVASLLGLFPSHAVSAEEIIEEVVVTGSRIATTNETASQPLLTIGAEAITSSGQVDLAELLNDVPQLTSSITLTNSLDGSAATISGTNNFGASALDLRGLGTERTLTSLTEGVTLLELRERPQSTSPRSRQPLWNASRCCLAEHRRSMVRML